MKCCPTCNIKQYTPIPGSNGDLPPKCVQQLGHKGDLYIVYDPIAALNKYKLCIWNALGSDFYIYFCPTCGRSLPH